VAPATSPAAAAEAIDGDGLLSADDGGFILVPVRGRQAEAAAMLLNGLGSP